MKVLITDFDFPNVELELELFRQAGLTVTTAQCKTEDDVIAAGQDADAFLLQYAPANRKVFEALPGLKIVSRYGAGFDTINTDDAHACGVWVGNSPDYGVHEVLALVEVGTHYAKRNVVVQADIGESLVVEQAESIVSADKVSLRVKLNDSVLLQSLYFRMDIKAWLAQKLVAA